MKFQLFGTAIIAAIASAQGTLNPEHPSNRPRNLSKKQGFDINNKFVEESEEGGELLQKFMSWVAK